MPDVQTYYFTSSPVLTGALLALSVGLLIGWRRIVAVAGRPRAILGTATLVALGLLSAWSDYRTWKNPGIGVAFDGDGVFCSSWNLKAPWQVFSAIELTTVRGPRSSIQFALDPQCVGQLAWTDYIKERKAVNCDVEDLTAHPGEIFVALRATWEKHRTSNRSED